MWPWFVLLVITIIIIYFAHAYGYISFDFSLGKPAESFQARMRTISGPNIYTQPYYASGNRVREAGQSLVGLAADGYFNDRVPIDSISPWDEINKISIAPAFAATVQRESNYLGGCGQKKGWCCPCPNKGRSNDALSMAMNGM